MSNLWKRSALRRRIKEWKQRLRAGRQDRRMRRRMRRDGMQALIANDTLVLEALIHLVRGARERDEREAAAAAAAAAASGGALARTLESGALLTGRAGLLSPELDLLAHLAPAVACRVALDVGAHHGAVTRALAEAGFQVHAFEPAPETYERLTQAVGALAGVRLHRLAVGERDGELDLHLLRAVDSSGGDPTLLAGLVRHSLPPTLAYGESVPVPVRSLESLVRAGEVPATVGVLKVDTEGYDLPVLRALGPLSPEVVVAEFWDEDNPMAREGAQNPLPGMVAEMRRRGYAWHVVLFRLWGVPGTGTYANHAESPEGSWGNVCFFRDATLFERAWTWCRTSLVPIRFGPRP